MSVSKRLRELRLAKGYSIADLTRASGVSHAYIRQIEAGVRQNPSGTMLQKMAVTLGVTVVDLMGTPSGIAESVLKKVPRSLRDLARKKGKQLGLRQEDVEMLKNIHFRGKRPSRIEDWELIFLFLKRILG